MNNSRSLKVLFSLLLSTFFSGHAFSQSKPNILWITIEDTSPHFIGCYGNQSASTPNIDKLSNSGVRFVNAFSTGTVCSPSRTALITGVKTFESGTGNHRSEIQLPFDMLGFPYYMQKAGYYTTNNSKTDYNVINKKEFIKQTWDESSPKAGWWNRKSGQPFFAVFNFTESHQSRTMTGTYADYKKGILDKLSPDDRIGEDDFDMPPFYRDSPEMRKQFARVYNSIKFTDNKIGELLNRLKEDNLTENTIIFFFSDHGEGIPRGKTNAINLGYRVPMAISFPQKYQKLSPWKAGDVSKELIDFSDLAPTLISMAGGKVPDYMKGRVLIGPARSKQADVLKLSSDRSDNGIDMARTITDGKYLYSRNYMPFMPEARYINYMETGEIKQLMRKDLADNKLNTLQRSVFEPRPAEFLFDTEKDLWETDNLSEKPEFQAQLLKMRKQLDQSILHSRDIMFLPEYELVQISGSEAPYNYRQDEKRYPIQDIYSIASLSGMRGSNVAEKQIKALQSNNKIIRYWAAVGLRSQSDEILKPYKKQLLLAVKDAFPPVSVSAAAIAWDVFGDHASQEHLKRAITNKNQEIAMLAMNYLLYVKDPRPFAVTVTLLNSKAESNQPIQWAVDDFFTSLESKK